MVKIIALFARSHRVKIIEAGGAASVVYGAASWFGAPAGWIVAGVALLVKSFEMDLLSAGEDGET